MTQINAKVIADSKNEFGNRITTMIVTMPRFILAEFNTHRMFSRNSASSRAIPFRKMVDNISMNPFIPIAWQKDHPGMQGVEYITDPDVLAEINRNWLQAKSNAVDSAMAISLFKGTKQLCNRLLEPFMYHTVIVTATEWENFFALRCPQYMYDDNINGRSNITYHRSKKDWKKKQSSIINNLAAIGYTPMINEPTTEIAWLQANKGQAEIHMMALAESMWDAYNESVPKELKAGEWHIPFGDMIELGQWGIDEAVINRIKVATARCARVSYTVVGEEDKPANYENDIKLHDRLVASGHWSPFEHCAKVMSDDEISDNYIYHDSRDVRDRATATGTIVVEEGWSGNFRGFIQYRKMFNNENITK
jgi:thymidylate synthase ThyX